ncbi:MAG: hypothetical protein L6R42_000377 [Xanthoria sp. 1 TBL-2021]|nr:MAG: hypothetical protein L6R42_000377 [Xanthoria sp. 1 TBL-2021]
MYTPRRGGHLRLQAAIMLLLDGQEGSLALDAILATAISGAQKLGLHRLGDAKLQASALPIAHSSPDNGSSASTEPPRIRTEIGIRICIQPSQFNTRMPLHINDDDLCPATLKVDANGHITERPRSEFTRLSYTVHALEIAVFARKSVDFRGPIHRAQRGEETNEVVTMRNHLNKEYEIFVAGLPSYFRLGSTVGLNSTGPMAAIPVHRWMLHQQLWSLFLRLHRASLASQDGRASCQLLAQNIISNQAHIQARCAVCGSLSTGDTQLFNAAIVLLVDLLLTSKHEDADRSSAQLRRLMIRDKVREAIELLRTQSDAKGSPSIEDPQSEQVKASAQRSVIVLEALMKLEEEESDSDVDSNGAVSTVNSSRRQGVEPHGSARKSLKSKVLDILEALRRNVENAATPMEQASPNWFPALDMSMPLTTATDGFLDLDVLPVLSNDPSWDFWQFLDFPPPPQSSTEDGHFPATVDLQTLVDSMPSRPSSSVAHSLSSFSTQGFSNVFSNSDGTGVSYMSPLSMESGLTRLNGGRGAAMTPSSTDAYIAAKLC